MKHFSPQYAVHLSRIGKTCPLQTITAKRDQNECNGRRNVSKLDPEISARINERERELSLLDKMHKNQSRSDTIAGIRGLEAVVRRPNSVRSAAYDTIGRSLVVRKKSTRRENTFLLQNFLREICNFLDVFEWRITNFCKLQNLQKCIINSFENSLTSSSRGPTENFRNLVVRYDAMR
jgi:hypothetical protein